MFNLGSIASALGKATGGSAFANNPANGFKTTFGDHLQGIGHSMMEHYRGQQPQALHGPTPLIAQPPTIITGHNPLGVPPLAPPMMPALTLADIVKMLG